MKPALSRLLQNALHADWHLHDSISHDGSGTPLDFALRARERGLSSIAVTNHIEELDLSDGHFDVIVERDLAKALRSREAIDQARAAQPGVEIRFGIELENNPRCYPQMEEIVRKARFEYIVGSAHLIDGVPVSSAACKPFLLRHKPEELYLKYYRELAGFVEWGKFDILGHPDIVKRYMTELFPDFKPLIPHDILRNIFTLMRNRGQGIEINTSGLFQAPREPYPCAEILEIALECGIERFVAGSDAHCPEDVGRGYECIMATATTTNPSDEGFHQHSVH